ncbi:MAG: phosphoglycerate dehydrogenase [Clostridiales bacterium]|nr:phosphoglycerate dehydrogenase [Clostridiales bacterium]MCF8023508.1 phosphoglycerate dehydrogenase [Clostridiales bacterium]
MSTYRVLVLDGVSEEGLVPLRQEDDIEVTTGKKMEENELAEVIDNYDALIVRSGTKVTPRIVEKASRLKIIGRAGVGVDNIDQRACTEKGILVVNAPEGNTVAATEQTMAMMLALARNTPQAVGKLKDGTWNKKAFIGTELRGKVLGIVGLGRIGSEVASRAKAMEMEVIGYDPYITEKNACSGEIPVLSKEEVFKQADFITLHMPKTKETYHLINDEAFNMMKEGVRIINCARGGIIDENALYRALESGKAAGAALDVFESEPNTDSPLLKFDNVIATPHLGASTVEAQVNVALEVSRLIASCLKGKLISSTVNVPSINSEVLTEARPYFKLAIKLGKIHAHLLNGRVSKIQIIYSGEWEKQEIKPITTSVIKGMLDPILQEKVNFVNAPTLAQKRGIQVTETIDSLAGGFANLITVKVITDKSEKLIAGTVLGEDESRIVLIDDYRIDTIPEGNMLYVPHDNKPNIIGQVASYLGNNNINITNIQAGQKNMNNGKGLIMLSVDEDIPTEIRDRIAGVEGVKEVKFIEL